MDQKRSTTVNYIFRDNNEKIFQCLGTIKEIANSVAETFAVWEAIGIATGVKLDSIIAKRDPQVAISSIMGKTVVPKQISNLVVDLNQ